MVLNPKWKTEGSVTHINEISGTVRPIRIQTGRWGLDRRIVNQSFPFDQVICQCRGTSRDVQNCLRDIQDMKSDPKRNSHEVNFRESCQRVGHNAINNNLPD